MVEDVRPSHPGPDPVLETARLRLRPLTAEDFETFYQTFVSDPVVMRFYHAYQRPLTVAERRARAQQDFFDHFAIGYERHGYRCWALTPGPSLAIPPETLLGWAGVVTAALDERLWGPELTYMIGSAWHGMGLATEASGAVLQDAWRRNALPRIHAVVDGPNAASIRVLERLGFLRHGTVEVYGSQDMVLYTLEAPVAGA